VAKFHNRLQDIFANLKHYDPKALKLSIYGEYFGGNWPLDHPSNIKGGPTSVQKGINYTPNHEFFAFDIYVTNSETTYWVDFLDIPKILNNLIPSVPVYVQGTFDEVFNVNI
jgi:hypothetical protein